MNKLIIIAFNGPSERIPSMKMYFNQSQKIFKITVLFFCLFICVWVCECVMWFWDINKCFGYQFDMTRITTAISTFFTFSSNSYISYFVWKWFTAIEFTSYESTVHFEVVYYQSYCLLNFSQVKVTPRSAVWCCRTRSLCDSTLKCIILSLYQKN